MSAREEILGRIRRALHDVPGDERSDDVVVGRGYRRRADAPRAELVRQLEDRLRDYSAGVQRVAETEIAPAVADACSRMQLRRIVVPPGLPALWRPKGVDVLEDDELSPLELDRVDCAVTGCATAIAQTGTLVLDGAGISGRRAITLVPDHHICVVREDQVVGLVPEAVERVSAAVSDRAQPITLISGPSASSDIELTRVEGVHGPRHLLVLIASG